VTRQYTNEFKAQVLKEVQEVGNAALVARRYELSKNTVYTWMRAVRRRGSTEALSSDGATTKGTPQDNDSRWAKMFLKGRELLITAVDLLSQIAPVKVFQIPGNHDYVTSWYAVVCLHDWFRNDENVTVDISPQSRKYVEFGKCLIGFTHGDKEKKRIFGNMQVEVPEAWGRTLYREWHTGHLHHEVVKEEHGVKVRSLSSVTATDAWHYVSGYVGALAVSQSFVWDKEKGLREIWYSTVS